MVKFRDMFAGLRSDEKGATAIEYGLLAALVAVAIIVAARGVGDQLESTFDNVKTELEGTSGGTGGDTTGGDTTGGDTTGG